MVLDGSRSAPVVVETFELTTQEADVVEQAHDLATNLGNRVQGLQPDAAMIQRADFFRMASNRDGPKFRLITEGALAHAVRARVPRTNILEGSEVAARGGKSKADLEAEALALVGDEDYCEAGCAALAILEP